MKDAEQGERARPKGGRKEGIVMGGRWQEGAGRRAMAAGVLKHEREGGKVGNLESGKGARAHSLTQPNQGEGARSTMMYGWARNVRWM